MESRDWTIRVRKKLICQLIKIQIFMATKGIEEKYNFLYTKYSSDLETLEKMIPKFGKNYSNINEYFNYYYGLNYHVPKKYRNITLPSLIKKFNKLKECIKNKKSLNIAANFLLSLHFLKLELFQLEYFIIQIEHFEDKKKYDMFIRVDEYTYIEGIVSKSLISDINNYELSYMKLYESDF